MNMMRFLAIASSILILSVILVSAQDNEAGPTLCKEDEPILTPLSEVERIDDLTFRYQNDLDQGFFIRFLEAGDPEVREQFIAEAQLCFEAQSLENLGQVNRISGSFGTVVIQDEERDYEIEIVVSETDDGVRMVTDIPSVDILAQTFKDMTELDIEALIVERDAVLAEESEYEVTVSSLLDERGLTIGDIIGEAQRRAIPDVELFEALLDELGYSDLSHDLVLDELALVYSEALEAPNLMFLQPPVQNFDITVGFELEFENLEGYEFYAIYFVIDPWIGQGMTHPYSLATNGSISVTITARQGCLGAVLKNSLGNKVDTAYVDAFTTTPTPSRDTLSGWAKTLEVTGKCGSNYYTLSGTWVRY